MFLTAHLLLRFPSAEKEPDMICHLISYLRARQRYRTALQELMSLSDRELADIGITRYDISHAVQSKLNPASTIWP